MSSMETICIFCKNTSHLGLIHFQQATWQTATNAARRRLSLKNDKFGSVTKDIRSFEIPKQPEKLLYHSKCFSQFCAINPLKPNFFKHSLRAENVAHCYD